MLQRALVVQWEVGFPVRGLRERECEIAIDRQSIDLPRAAFGVRHRVLRPAADCIIEVAAIAHPRYGRSIMINMDSHVVRNGDNPSASLGVEVVMLDTARDK